MKHHEHYIRLEHQLFLIPLSGCTRAFSETGNVKQVPVVLPFETVHKLHQGNRYSWTRYRLDGIEFVPSSFGSRST